MAETVKLTGGAMYPVGDDPEHPDYWLHIVYVNRRKGCVGIRVERPDPPRHKPLKTRKRTAGEPGNSPPPVEVPKGKS